MSTGTWAEVEDRIVISPALVSWNGIATVARHEFRLRLRAGRWRWILGIWFAVLLAFTALLREALVTSNSPKIGTPMFGGLMLFLLGLGLLVVPALTSQSVNGDRERGVLASLQVTLLTPADIALGKLLAAWATAAVFVLVSVPMVVWAMIEGGVGFLQAVVTLFVVVILLGIVCAIAQCFSAIFLRGTTSAVMSYVAVFVLTVGSVIGFGLAASATSEYVEKMYRFPACAEEGHLDSIHPETCVNPDGSTTPAQWHTERYAANRPQFEKVWWLLAPNPFVILADAAPTAPPYLDRSGRLVANDLDPMTGIANSVESTRRPPYEPAQSVVPAWTVGLAMDVLIGALAVATTIRRLRAPAGVLGRGVRIA